MEQVRFWHSSKSYWLEDVNLSEPQPCLCGLPDCLGHEYTVENGAILPGFTSLNVIRRGERIVRLLEPLSYEDMQKAIATDSPIFSQDQESADES